jgi:hypothetical protein
VESKNTRDPAGISGEAWRVDADMKRCVVCGKAAKNGIAKGGALTYSPMASRVSRNRLVVPDLHDVQHHEVQR